MGIGTCIAGNVGIRRDKGREVDGREVDGKEVGGCWHGIRRDHGETGQRRHSDGEGRVGEGGLTLESARGRFTRGKEAAGAVTIHAANTHNGMLAADRRHTRVPVVENPARQTHIHTHMRAPPCCGCSTWALQAATAPARSPQHTSPSHRTPMEHNQSKRTGSNSSKRSATPCL